MEQTIITGHLGKDAELVKDTDKNIIHFSVACTQKWIDKNGDENTKTNWYHVFKTVKNDPTKMLSYLLQGVKVYVLGRPSYKVNTGSQNISVSININALEMEILEFKNQD